jgi:putative ABC transport system permease protein
MLIKIAWRNLWRNRRRTVLTLAAIGLGLTFLIAMVSFVYGMQEMMIEQVAKSSNGHVQLHHPEYLEKRTARLVMRGASRLNRVIEGIPEVSGFSSRLLFSGAIRSSRASAVHVVRVVAVDPERERRFSSLADKVIKGGFVTPPPEAQDPDAPARVRGRHGVLIGKKLAAHLKVDLGSKLRLDTAGFQGATVAAAFYVTGILETGSDLFDKHTVLVALADMQAVTGAGDVAHEISLMVAHEVDPAALAARVQEAITALPDAGAVGPVVVQTWWEVLPDIKQLIDMTGAWNGVLYLLMMVILSAGILTTLFMAVFERQREFGIQLALGTRGRTLFGAVMLEALFIALLSAALGLAFGGLIVTYLVQHGLDLSWLMGGFDFAGMFIENVYRGSATPRVFLEPTLVVVTATVLFALWPAVKVARMRALDGIRQGGVRG